MVEDEQQIVDNESKRARGVASVALLNELHPDGTVSGGCIFLWAQPPPTTKSRGKLTETTLGKDVLFPPKYHCDFKYYCNYGVKALGAHPVPEIHYSWVVALGCGVIKSYRDWCTLVDGECIFHS
jgi:hypothetical protein